MLDRFQRIVGFGVAIVAAFALSASASEAFLPIFRIIMDQTLVTIKESPFQFIFSLFVVSITLIFAIRALTENFANLKTEKSTSAPIVEERYIRNLGAKIDKLLSDKDAGRLIELSPDEREKILSSIIEKNKINLDDALTDRLKSAFSKLSVEETKARVIRRMEYQTEVLGSRATFSLTWGMIFASGGIISLILTFMLFPLKVNLGDWKEYLINYAPRFTITIIIEIIAFFFLKLYAKALNEVRYLQNEITNFESRSLAHSTAMALNSKPLIESVVHNLLATERNFILDKGQTTVEIERERADAQGLSHTLRAASTIIHGEVDGAKPDRKKAGQE